ncbi:MAG: hypothetical protein K0S55_2019 [Clostridia bacterium]|jgi:HEPN domain-containing protein|nr:hypothetical protein [Clostridia bacterium]
MRRRQNNNDSNRYFDWLERAESDLESARILKENNGDNCNAAFHCQQCIEKALKAYLLFMKNSHFDGHNLTYLCRQAMNYDKYFDDWLDESTELNRFYIETRYPTDIGFDIDNVQLDKIYTDAKNMYDFIFKKVKLKVFE